MAGVGPQTVWRSYNDKAPGGEREYVHNLVAAGCEGPLVNWLENDEDESSGMI